MSSYNYIQAISLGFPAVQCICVGDGSVYENLTAVEGYVLPTQDALDQWIAANPYQEVDTTKRITGLAFRNRFTTYEKTFIELMSSDDPTAELGARMNAAFIRAMLKDASEAAYVDLLRDDTRSSVQAMEAQNLIAAGRAAIILDSPVQDFERPTYPEPAF